LEERGPLVSEERRAQPRLQAWREELTQRMGFLRACRPWGRGAVAVPWARRPWTLGATGYGRPLCGHGGRMTALRSQQSKEPAWKLKRRVS